MQKVNTEIKESYAITRLQKWGVQVYECGRKAINPNYLLQSIRNYIAMKIMMRKIKKHAEMVKRGKCLKP